ncbi:hypothetical protein J2X04_002860 [Lysobacter niabensis]|jgi:hypothetical protein|uniref:DUF4405 domain-containing protein n=1 Tax=Agrilutibacter niabensis TaxID=380628 RepID=A0ABU1VSM8_9GAMM|nr:hypothetical protein [Lysobacter niabensis]MDR7100479.1 hypothetical protein [Lysobacter niabensis]
MKHHGHERLRLPAWVRAWVYVAGALCALSGAAWLLLHHFVRREGQFGPEASPLEHPSLVLHGVCGLLLLWVLGLVWFPHVRRGWSRPRHRWVGGTMAALMLWLAVSAAGLYYLGDEQWRGWVSLAHWSLGLFAAFWLPFHIWVGRRRARRG